MAGRIRIDSGVRTIEVNDQGECVTLPLSDDGFVLGFYRLVEYVQSAGKQAAQGASEGGSIDVMEKLVALEKETAERTDALFGAGTCRKVFGDITPSMDLFAEFFGELMPFFEEYKSARAAKLEKYHAGRTGSSV